MSSRRNFLLGVGIGSAAFASAFSPIRKLLLALLTGGDPELGGLKIRETRNFLQLNLYGAPSRWFFDNSLKPYDDSIFYRHPMHFNRITGKNQFDYQTHKYGGINMPYLWKFGIPKQAGGSTPMTNLLDNFMTIRGVQMEGTIGHPANCAKLVAPSLGGVSLDGLLADRSDCLVSAISIGGTPANRAFKARSSTVLKIKSNQPNYLAYILDPFLYQGRPALENSEEITGLVDQALDEVRLQRNGQAEHFKPLYSDLKKARRYLLRNIESFLSEYDSLIKKYHALIERAHGTELSGINDYLMPGLELPQTVKGKLSERLGLGRFYTANHFVLDGDLRGILKNAQIGHLAQEFALAEFIFKKGLSTSLVIAPENEMGHLFFKAMSSSGLKHSDVQSSYDKSAIATTYSMRPGAKPAPCELLLSMDSHHTGSMVNFITCNHYYYAYATCLNELISSFKATKLKRGNLFDETVIQLTAEFERLPNYYHDGSKHNELAHVSSFFSGIIKGPQVLGNIFTGHQKYDDPESRDLGTVGFSAPVAELGNRPIGISNLSSSISKMLRVPAIVKRAPSIIDVKNNTVTSKIEKAKNVQGESISYFNI